MELADLNKTMKTLQTFLLPEMSYLYLYFLRSLFAILLIPVKNIQMTKGLRFNPLKRVEAERSLKLEKRACSSLYPCDGSCLVWQGPLRL
jgi:hypothetical protein